MSTSAPPADAPETSVPRQPGTGSDVVRAERAWLDGDLVAAIEAADHALATGTDIDGRAAAVAAAAAAADCALLDASRRWRGVASALEGSRGAWAAGRAALIAGLAGDVDAASQDLAAAHGRVPVPAPRGLTVLLDGAAATINAVRGEVDGAARRLAGLATAAVSPDPLTSDRWDELAMMVVAAGGDARTALAMSGESGDARSGRRRLLAAWLALRTGRLTTAREALTAAAGTAVLRRDAVLAAAVSAGLARRSGDERVISTTWRRVAPVIAGADVEILLLDAWGELAATAAAVSPAEGRIIGEAMAAAVTRAGSPWWAVAAEAWWRLERAIVVDDAAAAVAADVARTLTGLAAAHPALVVRAEGATAWAAVLAGTVQAPEITRVSSRLAAAGHRHDAATLCAAAAARACEPDTAKALLALARGLRAPVGARRRTTGDELSDRECDVGRLVIDGLTHKQIGARLYISPKTVEQHVARLRQKLGAPDRAALVGALRRHLEDRSG